MKYEKCKVVMLPTEKATIGTIMKYIQIAPFHDSEIDGHLGTLVQNKNRNVTKSNNYWQAQHLYILSDEEIKEKFEGYCIDDEGFIRNGMSDLHTLSLSKKIIASTDQSLGLPRPSDSFIKKYCELGGIDEVLVEYEDKGKWGHKQYEDGTIDANVYYSDYKLKVTPDNTIKIKPVKDTLTKEDIENFTQTLVEIGKMLKENA